MPVASPMGNAPCRFFAHFRGRRQRFPSTPIALSRQPFDTDKLAVMSLMVEAFSSTIKDRADPRAGRRNPKYRLFGRLVWRLPSVGLQALAPSGGRCSMRSAAYVLQAYSDLCRDRDA